ncbi:MAG: AraC family transcriptional regulator [Butyrivibrio sp.]|nr:AraC family transcriptional regulator [Butyrivibrio sp.]
MNNRTYYCSAFNSDSSETVAYNNPLFPAYVRYGYLSAYPDYTAISHWHDDLEFILIKKGKMIYNVNGDLIELPEGCGIMVNSRQLHYGFAVDSSECEFLCILLSPELLRGNEWFYQNYIEPVTKNPPVPYLYLDGGASHRAVLERLDRIYLSFGARVPNAASYFELLENFAAIMKTLYKSLNAPHRTAARESSELTALRSIITYIEERYFERITLEDIAQSGSCCKSKCSLLFKKYLRDTPITYITKLRLRKSLDALLDSDKSITDIAYENGFCGSSYYCETFKKYYGLSPLAYRKSRAGMGQDA